MGGIVSHHALAAETPREGADAVHHPINPSLRQPICIAVVEAGNHLLLERFIQSFCITCIGNFIVDVATSLTNGKPIDTVIGLAPPAIENTAIQPTV